VGFHADPSDIEVAIELVHFSHDVEIRALAFFKTNALAEHENTHVISLFQACIGQPHGIINGFAVIRRDNEEYIHGWLLGLDTLNALENGRVIQNRAFPKPGYLGRWLIIFHLEYGLK
jgi:hypothetical protein